MNTRTEAQATASIPSAMVNLIGSAVAEIRTGARNRKENGFCNPPVKNSSPASSTMFSASSAAANDGSSRSIGLNQSCRIRFKSAEKPTMERHGTTSTSNSRPCSTMKMGAGCPSGAARPAPAAKYETLCEDEDGGELPRCREPAQPQDRVQTDLAAGEAKIG